MSTRYEREVERQRKLIRAKKMLREMAEYSDRSMKPLLADGYVELIEERVNKNESCVPVFREMDDAHIDDNLRSVERYWEETMSKYACPDDMDPEDFIRKLKAKREAERLE